MSTIHWYIYIYILYIYILYIENVFKVDIYIHISEVSIYLSIYVSIYLSISYTYYIYVYICIFNIYTYTLVFSYFKNFKFSQFRVGGSSLNCRKFINMPFFGHTTRMSCLPKIYHIYILSNLYIYIGYSKKKHFKNILAIAFFC